MPIEPFVCKVHGATDAYVYERGKRKNPRYAFKVSTCRLCRRSSVSRDWQRVKSEILKAYGGMCACCGEKEPAFLTIDHTHGGGSAHRKAGFRGWRLYQWLRKQGYPKRGYQILCFNCNCAKGSRGICPHKA